MSDQNQVPHVQPNPQTPPPVILRNLRGEPFVVDMWDIMAIEEGRRLRKPGAPPVYPKLEMPPSPDIVDKNDAVTRADGEGQLNPGTPGPLLDVPPPAPGKARIMICIPMLDVKYEFFESFMKFWTELCVANDQRYEIGYHIAYRKPVHMAEEYLVKVALANKATHILLMDDDIYDVRKSDLDKLLVADKDIIGGVMHASKFPHAMCVFRRYDRSKKVIDMPSDNTIYRLYEVPCLCGNCGAPQSHWDGKFCPACSHELNNLIQQADLIPFPFTLIKMSVFDKIKKPWFHCTNEYPTDSWFADRLIEAGMTEYAHMGVRLNHAGITDETKPFYMQMGMAKAQKSGGIVNLDPVQMDIHQNLLINKMKETEEKMRTKPPIIAEGKLVSGEIKDDLTLMTHGH